MPQWLASALVIAASVLILLIIIFMLLNSAMNFFKNWRMPSICKNCKNDPRKETIKKGGD